LALSLITTAVLAQSEKNQEPEDVVRVRTDLIAVPVIVTDKRGRRVSGLGAGDFRLADDERATPVKYFAEGTDRVAMLFALDASGSAREILSQQHDAALALFGKFGAASRVAALHFSDVVKLVLPFTSDPAGVARAFNLAAEQSTGTAIFDGAAAAVRSFDGSGGFSSERRIVVLISDGLDTLSSTKPDAVIELARRRGVSFYVIHFQLFTPRDGILEARPPAKGFRELAEKTGGRYFKFGSARLALDPKARYDLAPVFQAIEQDLLGQYVLGFSPGEAARDGRLHRVTVNLTTRAHQKFTLVQLRTDYTLKD